MATIEEQFIIEGKIETHGGEMFHRFKPPNAISISQWRILDYPITGYVVMDILILLVSLVKQ